MLHTKFQASKPSGSEEENFLNIFLCISMAPTYDPWPEAILDPGTFIWINLVEAQQAKLHT